MVRIRFFSRQCCRIPFQLAALLLIWMVVSVSALRAQSQQSKGGASHLDSVEVSGSKRFSSGEIAGSVGLRAGNIITREDLQAAADTLAALGLFSNVQYHFTTVVSGVRATYQLTDTPTVSVAFDNFPWFTDEELTAALKRTVPLFDGNAPLGGTLLNAMSGTLENLVQARGVFGTVSHTLVNFPLGGQRMQFRVEGAEITIKGIDFSDELANQDRAIQQSASQLIGKPYSRGTIELFEFEQVRPVYLTHAFLHVQFGPLSTRVTTDPAQPGSYGVVVALPLVPGPTFKWGGVTWSGNSAMTTDDLNALVDLKPGEIAEGNRIAALWERVQGLYGERGYLDAKLNPAPQFDEPATRITYNVAVTEGLQYHMGNLVLSGLSVDGEKRVRAAWGIPVNAVFNEKVYENFLDAGVKHAFAGTPVHYDKIGRFLQENPATGRVDVLLDFQ
jgi:outer membrane protein insertion porin family